MPSDGVCHTADPSARQRQADTASGIQHLPDGHLNARRRLPDAASARCCVWQTGSAVWQTAICQTLSARRGVCQTVSVRCCVWQTGSDVWQTALCQTPHLADMVCCLPDMVCSLPDGVWLPDGV